MDLQLKQWRNQQQQDDGSEHQQPPESEPPSAKLPKLVLNEPHYHHHQLSPHQHLQNHPSLILPFSSSSASAAASTLPLFVPDNKLSSGSVMSAAFADSSSASASPRFPRMGSYFSLAQWQELELQALIYRYMLSGVAVPTELLHPIKKSLPHTPYFLPHPLHHYPQYQPALLQAGYWGRASMDPEPGRCRRTDGKKWRCSRDVVPGQKYCERHMHRGRNRSRKPVEIPAPAAAANGSTVVGGIGGSNLKPTNNPVAAAPLAVVAGGDHFTLSGPSSPSVDLFQSYTEPKIEHKSLFEPQSEVNNRSGSHILRHFFDDWPRSLQEPDHSPSNASPLNSSTCLSISIPENSSSDVSLKLSTGNAAADETSANDRDAERDPPRLSSWATGWSPNQVASMGGPLAEALRSSTSHSSSPTSVLHQLPRGSASETSFVST